MEILLLIVALIAIGLWYLSKWISKDYDFFEKQGIKFKKPYPFIGTNTFLFRGVNLLDHVKETYDRFPNEKVSGIFDFGSPLYIIRDPILLKHIAVKEFDHFPDHKSFIDAKDDPILGNLLTMMKGKKWHDMRSSLSPAFTGSKMRLMCDFASICGEQMAKSLKKDTVYEMKELFSKFTNDVIATCAFGIKCDSFENPKNEFYKIGQDAQNNQTFTQLLKFILVRFFPKLTKLIGIKMFSGKSRKQFNKMIIETMDTREKNKIIRPDMIQLLMQLRKGELKSNDEETVPDSIAAVNETDVKTKSQKLNWTDDEIIAQCLIFFLAGFETSASLMSFASYELAIHPEIQAKLIKEIDETREKLNGQTITYEALQSMKYLDMVIAESLRKWPPAPVTERLCVKDFAYEDEDGLKFFVKKDTSLWIPMYGFHMDPKYFPEPEKFDPERFSEERKDEINFNAYLPFGIGPRNCIGSRFALMEIKIALYHLLSNFTFEVCEQTQIPLKLKRTMAAIKPEKGINLQLKPRKI